MAIERKDKEPKEGNSVLESSSRRKAVKTIVGGVTAFAAYNALPAKWGTPLIEQVFLPAHAATSGVTGFFSITSPSLTRIDNEQTGLNLQELLAKVGKSIGDFVVSDAHADDIFVLCVSLTETTMSLSITEGTLCYAATGTPSKGIVLIGYKGIVTLTLTLISTTPDTITVKAHFVETGGPDGAFTWVLDRVNSSCLCEDNRPA